MDDVRTWCGDCGGTGHLSIPRMGVATLGIPLGEALATPALVGTVGENRHCETCDGQGWLPGMVIPV